MPAPRACPDLARLQSLAAGELSSPESEALLSHLESCDSCVRRLEGLPEKDTFVELIRQAHAEGDPPGAARVAGLIAKLRKLQPDLEAAKTGAAPLVVKCPGCGKRFKANPKLSGKTVKCPNCRAALAVPAAAVPAEAPTVLPAGGETAAPVEPANATGVRAVGPTGSYHRPEPDTGERELCEFLAPAQAPDELGRLGPYRVLQILGAGGMGVVYRAEDPELKRPVALKAMLPSLGASQSARKRFLREAQAAAAITHDNIVHIYQVGEDRGVPFIAMQFLDGESLDARLRREPRLPAAEVLRVGRETAEGLAAAHERGLIHRDIKPANLWLEGAKGRVKILDFGLARGASDEGHLTQTGAIVGTPAYMAPEQAGGKKVDQRCDLFSLGCVLYRLATGEPPFKGDDMISVLAAVALDNPPPPATLNPDIPDELSDLVMRLLAKDADRRPESARVVAGAIQTIEGEVGAQGARPRKAKQGPAAGTRSARAAGDGSGKGWPPWPWLAGAAGGLFALVLAGTLVLWPTPRGVVRIESDDPNVRIIFDRDGPTVEGAGREPISLRAGEHGVRVKRGDFEFDAEKFVLRKGETVTLKVELLPGKLRVQADGKILGVGDLPSEPADGTRRAEPPAKAVSADTDRKVTESPAKTVPADVDRKAAEWALSIGGTIKIHEAGPELEIKGADELSTGAFELTAVDLHENPKATNAGLDHFKDCTNLRVLVLRRTKVTNAGLANFKLCKNLTHLDLTGARVNDAGLISFNDCKNLTELHLGATQVSHAGLAYLNLTNLRVLDLWGNPRVTDAALAQLKGLRNLNRLYLYGCHGVSDSGLAHLKDLVSLTELDLNATQVTDAGLVHLKELRNITSLNLMCTPVTGAGLMHLRGLSRLRQLLLHGGKVCDAGLVNIEGLTSLVNLSLGDSEVSDGGLAHVEGLTNLGGLYLGNSKVSDAGLVHLKGLTKLRRLELQRTRVSDAGIVHLTLMKGLAELDLTGTDVTAAGLAKLKTALPRCKIIHSVAASTAPEWRLVGQHRGATCVAVSPDGRRMVSGGADRVVRLWDLDSGVELKSFAGHADTVFALAVSPDGRYALSGGQDKQTKKDFALRLWDLEAGQEARRLTGHAWIISRAVFFPDGQRALTSSWDATARVWDVKTGRELRRYRMGLPVVSAALVPGGRRFLFASTDNLVRLWDLESDKEVGRFVADAGPNDALAVSPDGRRAVGGGRSGTLRVWDVETGKELHRLGGHTAAVWCVAVTPDGRRALSAGGDKTLRLWDLTTGKEMHRFEGHTDVVWSVAIVPSGRQAVSVGSDNTIRMWKLPE